MSEKGAEVTPRNEHRLTKIAFQNGSNDHCEDEWSDVVLKFSEGISCDPEPHQDEQFKGACVYRISANQAYQQNDGK